MARACWLAYASRPGISWPTITGPRPLTSRSSDERLSVRNTPHARVPTRPRVSDQGIHGREHGASCSMLSGDTD